jgi:hypothetical protein
VGVEDEQVIGTDDVATVEPDKGPMATANVTCISCGEDTTFEYPEGHPDEIVWEHHCGNKGRFRPPSFVPPVAESVELPDGVVAVSDADGGTGGEAEGG